MWIPRPTERYHIPSGICQRCLLRSSWVNTFHQLQQYLNVRCDIIIRNFSWYYLVVYILSSNDHQIWRNNAHTSKATLPKEYTSHGFVISGMEFKSVPKWYSSGAAHLIAPPTVELRSEELWVSAMMLDSPKSLRWAFPSSIKIFPCCYVLIGFCRGYGVNSQSWDHRVRSVVYVLLRRPKLLYWIHRKWPYNIPNLLPRRTTVHVHMILVRIEGRTDLTHNLKSSLQIEMRFSFFQVMVKISFTHPRANHPRMRPIGLSGPQ